MVCRPQHETLPMLQSSVRKTGAESTTNTIQFNHHIFQTPKITKADRIHKETMELTKAIKNEPSENTLEHVNVIIKLRTILQERKKIYKRDPQNLNPSKSMHANQTSLPRVPTLLRVPIKYHDIPFATMQVTSLHQSSSKSLIT